MIKQLVTPGQAAHRAAFGAPLSGAMPADVWEINLNEDSKDWWERVARKAIQQFNSGSSDGRTPGCAVFDAGVSRGSLQWSQLPQRYRDHYERIAQAAIDTLVNAQ